MPLPGWGFTDLLKSLFIFLGMLPEGVEQQQQSQQQSPGQPGRFGPSPKPSRPMVSFGQDKGK